MADIAAVFHWPLSELSALSLPELALWWHKARQRSGVADSATDEPEHP